jgi:undecaprenyl-diphosphatase
MLMDDRHYLGRLRDLATVFWVIVVLMYLAIALPDARAWVQSVDDRVFTMAVDGEASPLVSIAKVATFIGSLTVMFPLMLVVAGYLYWKKRITTALFWVSALAISEALLWTSKFIYARPRPPMSLVQTHGYSFPSGHANTAATVALGIALLLAIRRSRHWYFEILAVMYIATIAWSRVYLRAHWLSDVFTGAALGAAVVVTAFLAVSSLERRGRLPAGDHPNPTT